MRFGFSEFFIKSAVISSIIASGPCVLYAAVLVAALLPPELAVLLTFLTRL